MTDKWLEELEAQVRTAAKQLRQLRKDNAELRKKLAALEKSEGSSKKVATASEPAWDEERQEIRKRVEKLTKHLESLL